MLSLALGALAASQTEVVEQAPVGRGDHWAVLVAGSAGYGNYRHQADVCHAYQLVAKSGIKPEQIIVLAVDDIANNSENPYPGKMFNKPTPQGTPGVDVYAGCKIDYSGDDVTPETFTKVLTGDASAGGKVLQSTEHSRVFVNFVDHGGVNIIGFPKTTMHATELVGALQKMHDTNMYKELVFYLEACESGSMFATLPADIKIYATTAANAKESSWGTYCMPDDKVDGVEIRSCLGDLYSVTWMEDSDVKLGTGETLAQQFTTVKALTNKSHVTEFGDVSIKSEIIDNFQGKTDRPGVQRLGMTHLAETHVPKRSSSLPSADAEMASAYARFMATTDPTAAEELMQGIKDRMQAKARFEKMSLAVMGRRSNGLVPDRVDNKCHYAAHKAYIRKCGEWTTGALKYSANLAEMCEHTQGDARSVVAAINEACAEEA